MEKVPTYKEIKKNRKLIKQKKLNLIAKEVKDQKESEVFKNIEKNTENKYMLIFSDKAHYMVLFIKHSYGFEKLKEIINFLKIMQKKFN